MIEIRKGQAPAPLTRAEFSTRFRAAFFDPAFRAEDASIARLEEIAWQAHYEYRKSPFTQKAGPGYADPDYDFSSERKAVVEWRAGRLRAVQPNLSRPRPK